MTAALNEEGLRVVAVAVEGNAAVDKDLPRCRRGRSDPDRLRRLPRSAQGNRRAGAEGAGRARRGGQGADRRQRTGDREDLPRGGPGGERHPARLGRGADERCGTGAGGGDAQRLRQADARPQGAHRAAAEGQRPRGRLHGRRHQRRAGAAHRRHRHLGGYRGGYRQGSGRHHPAGKEPDGAGGRRASKAARPSPTCSSTSR